MKKILFTGGGSAGHIIPNIALMEHLICDFQLAYIGSGEKDKAFLKSFSEFDKIDYHQIEACKLQRKFCWQNFLLPFKLISSIFCAKKILKITKPNLVFSKGGFVSLPVVIAAWMSKIPVLAHESDLTMGLANKIAKPFCTKILTTFEKTKRAVGKKALACGCPIRNAIYSATMSKGLEAMGFDGKRKIITVVGGSQGATSLNNCIEQSKDLLTKNFDVFLIGGHNKVEASSSPHFSQAQFVNNIFDVFAASDVVVSRAGSNTICELVAMKKPTILVPLQKASRGEQLANAKYFCAKNACLTLNDDALSPESLQSKISFALKFSTEMKHHQSKIQIDGTQCILKQIRQCVGK